MSQLSINNAPVAINLPLQVLKDASQPISLEGSSRDLFALLKTKRYVATATCVLEHIVMTPDLTPDEKRFWLVLSNLASIELNSLNSCSFLPPTPFVFREEVVISRGNYRGSETSMNIG